MAIQGIPPGEWKINDLLDLGKKSGITWIKAVPVLILEKWVREGKVEGEANCVQTKPLADRLENCGLHPPFTDKGTSTVLGGLRQIQKARKLTRPSLLERIKPEGQGWFRVELPYYESLLQDYRKKYREKYPDDYKKLFELNGEPDDWEGLPKERTKRREIETMLSEPEAQDDIQSLLAPIERAFRDRQQEIERLTEENQKLRAMLESKTKENSGVSFVHTSPDFHRSWYDGKVTSIKDTIGDMLKRAEHAIRISTRQMDMFSDDLIALKRRSPEIEITILSRGPQGAEGDRKKLAGRAFEKMKESGIKLPVEKDTLHSRLIVIDTTEVLVSSADLDYTQMDLEFNAGIWTNNPDAVAEAIRYFDNLLRLSQGN